MAQPLLQARVDWTEGGKGAAACPLRPSLSACWHCLLGDPECRQRKRVTFMASGKPGSQGTACPSKHVGGGTLQPSTGPEIIFFQRLSDPVTVRPPRLSKGLPAKHTADNQCLSHTFGGALGARPKGRVTLGWQVSLSLGKLAMQNWDCVHAPTLTLSGSGS